jgi:hypothetical protein
MTGRAALTKEQIKAAADRAEGKAAERVDQAIKAGDDKAEVKRLAGLSRLEYERERKPAAEKLGIERLPVLDALVKDAQRSAPRDRARR